VKFRKEDTKTSQLDQLIAGHISTMAGMDEESEEYAAAAKALRTLYEAKGLEPKPDRIDRNTMLIVAANLAGIIAILSFEKANVIGSKALQQIIKPRI
jgi:hypothetical protein